MMDVEYYRAEAERCHQLAEGSKDPKAAARWRAMSRDYHALADEVEAVVLRTSMQQQPVQQVQSKERARRRDELLP